MNREDIKQTMLLAMSEHHSGNAEEAIQIVDAQIAALEAAGVRLVPVEATEEMLVAGARAHDDFFSQSGPHPRTKAVHRAMLAASPYAPPGG